MKQRVWHHNPKRIRFVRWSRNAAAAFHSIRMEVTIGRLKANVQERIAPKANALVVALSNAIHLDPSEEEREKEYIREAELCNALLYTMDKPMTLEVNDAFN